ncbi:hypothetical protein BCBMB205_04280 [Bacillus sp. CN2]|nr:hypothetical protein BCBMB205_04280 [Bacillus velezensis]ARZ56752.1 hypothetical protein BAGQ_0483 [Bacillus velezensis]GFR56368.1 hypothetical protein BCBMB205_04280 [Bacillus sp. CN2]
MFSFYEQYVPPVILYDDKSALCHVVLLYKKDRGISACGLCRYFLK